MKPEISKIEWLILDILSDDWECYATICPGLLDNVSTVTRDDVFGSLHCLLTRGLIRLMDYDGFTEYSESLLRQEPDQVPGSKFWFGLSDLGCAFWQASATRFGEEPIDWQKSWVATYNTGSKDGHIDGFSEEVCMEQIQHLLRYEPSLEVDQGSLRHEEINGFRAKYFQYIHGGHRISFKLQEKGCEPSGPTNAAPRRG